MWKKFKMWMSNNAPIGSRLRPKLKSTVRFENLNDNSKHMRKYGFTGFAIDDIGDQRFLIHASNKWFKLSKNENGTWDGTICFGI